MVLNYQNGQKMVNFGLISEMNFLCIFLWNGMAKNADVWLRCLVVHLAPCDKGKTGTRYQRQRPGGWGQHSLMGLCQMERLTRLAGVWPRQKWSERSPQQAIRTIVEIFGFPKISDRRFALVLPVLNGQVSVFYIPCFIWNKTLVNEEVGIAQILRSPRSTLAYNATAIQVPGKHEIS